MPTFNDYEREAEDIDDWNAENTEKVNNILPVTICPLSAENIKSANNQQDEKARTRNGDTILTDEVTTPEIPLAINGDSNPADSESIKIANLGGKDGC
jgi:hypothetical protein